MTSLYRFYIENSMYQKEEHKDKGIVMRIPSGEFGYPCVDDEYVDDSLPSR